MIAGWAKISTSPRGREGTRRHPGEKKTQEKTPVLKNKAGVFFRDERWVFLNPLKTPALICLGAELPLKTCRIDLEIPEKCSQLATGVILWDLLIYLLGILFPWPLKKLKGSFGLASWSLLEGNPILHFRVVQTRVMSTQMTKKHI